MRSLNVALSCITLVAAPMCAQTVTAFTGAIVLDGRGGPPLSDATVIVRGTTIETVGPTASTPVPAGATRVDARGKVLMPGLADMHVHLTGGWDGERSDMLGYPRYMHALLYAGITTVHDMGNALPYVEQLKQETSAGRIAGPRIFMVGGLVDGADPLWPDISFSLVSTDQAPGIVRKMKSSGADAIKAYIGLSERLLTALVRAAAADSMRVVADLGASNGSDWGIRTGISAYAHAPTSVLSDATISTMKQRGMMNISTLAVFESFARRRLRDIRFLDEPLLARSMPPQFVEELRVFAQRPASASENLIAARYAERLTTAMANIRRMHAAGVPIVAGTDSPYPGVFFGEGLHRELELLVEAGLTPLEAISAATSNAARFAHDDAWGTIEAGKRADLLLIDGRPHERISDTRRIVALMQQGRLLDRTQLTFSALRDGGLRAVDAALSTK